MSRISRSWPGAASRATDLGSSRSVDPSEAETVLAVLASPVGAGVRGHFLRTSPVAPRRRSCFGKWSISQTDWWRDVAAGPGCGD
jgi:hypothetical protein